MFSSYKHQREYSQTPLSNNSFSTPHHHDPWRRLSDQQDSSLHGHQSTPRNTRIKFDDIEQEVSCSAPVNLQRHDRNNIVNKAEFRGVDIPRTLTRSQSRAAPSPMSSKKRKIKKSHHKYQTLSQPVDSPFVPDAVSTPRFDRKTKPTPILMPIDPRLTNHDIRLQQQASRRHAIDKQADLTFTSHVPSSPLICDTSSSGSSSDVSTSTEESDGTPSPKPKEAKSKTRDAASSTKSPFKEKRAGKDRKHPIDLSTKDGPRKKKSESKRIKDASTEPSPKPTTKQTNQDLESTLFASLTTIIPSHLVTHAHTALTTEVQTKARTSHEAQPYSGSSSGPSERAVTLRAAHDLLVRLSAQRLVNNTSGANMEGDLARIANDRARRIEVLEMEVCGLKQRVEQFESIEEEESESENEERRKRRRR